jgi:hypothetical protein
MFMKHTHPISQFMMQFFRIKGTSLMFSFVFLSAVLQAQLNFPPPSSCTSKDLELVSARLLSQEPCFNCTAGNTVENTLVLAINNKTGSTRTSFAFWGTLVELNADGSPHRERPISGCVGPVPRNAITSFSSVSVNYVCGKTLKIKNLYLAWTDASSKNTCAVLTSDVSKINPKCGTLPEIAIQAGVDMTYTTTKETCTAKGSAELKLFGGTAPYTATLVLSGTNTVVRNVAQAFGTASFTDLAAGTYTVTLKDKNNCIATRQVIIGTDKPATPNPVVAGAESCFSSLPSGGLTATIVSPQEGVTYTWYNAASGGAVVANPSATTVGTTTYYAEASIGDCKSENRSEAVLVIKRTPVAPVGAEDPDICEPADATILTAEATAEENATISWYSAATGGTSVANPVLSSVGTVTYYAEATLDGCVSTSRGPAMLTIRDTPDAPGSGGDKYECEKNPIQTLTATATSTATIIWYPEEGDQPIEGEPTLSSIGTVTYSAEADLDGCKSYTKTPVILEIFDTPDTPSDAAGGSECEKAPIQKLTATAKVVDGATLTWYAASAGGDAVLAELQSIGSKTFYGEASIAYTGGSNTYVCRSFDRIAATLEIKETPDAPLSGGDQSECEEIMIQTLTAIATSDATINWYNDQGVLPANSTPSLSEVGSVTYSAEAELDGCKSFTKTPVTLEIKERPANPTGDDQEECDSKQTLTASAEGTDLKWYDAATAGDEVTDLTQTGVGSLTLYAEANDNGCASFNRLAVTLTINATPAKPEICVVQPSLCGSATGSITFLSPTGAGYEYSIDGGETYSTETEYSALAAGSVSGISVKSDKGCVSEATDCNASDCTKPAPKPLVTPLVETPVNTKEVPATEETNATDLRTSVPSAGEEAVKVIPNPFADQVRFVVNVPMSGHFTLEVFDVRGTKVATVFDGFANEGVSQFEFQSPMRQQGNLVYIARCGQKLLGKGQLMQVRN